MSVRFGLGIGATEVRGVIMRHGVLAWHSSAAVDGTHSVATAIGQLLREAPLPPRRRVTVVAAIGPSLAQTKQLLGVPLVNDLRLLDEMALQNAGRFFLGGEALVISPVWRSKTGSVWCAAFDAAIVRAVAVACEDRRLHFVGAIPTALVLGPLTSDGKASWRDGGMLVDVVAPSGLPQTMRRRLARYTLAHTPPTVTALAALGDDSWRFADAFGAATCGLRAPLLWRAAEARRHVTGRVARASLVALLTLASVAAMLAPGTRAHMVARSAQRTPAVHPIVQLNSDLRLATGEIDRIESFAASRRSVSRLLSGLAEVLPDSAAIVSLRVDSAGASMVTLSRRAADIVPQLREVDGVLAGTISGTASRETVAGASLERATIKLAFAKP